jgi:hypothetical protein
VEENGLQARTLPTSSKNKQSALPAGLKQLLPASWISIYKAPPLIVLIGSASLQQSPADSEAQL